MENNSNWSIFFCDELLNNSKSRFQLSKDREIFYFQEKIVKKFLCSNDCYKVWNYTRILCIFVVRYNVSRVVVSYSFYWITITIHKYDQMLMFIFHLKSVSNYSFFVEINETHWLVSFSETLVGYISYDINVWKIILYIKWSLLVDLRMPTLLLRLSITFWHV